MQSLRQTTATAIKGRSIARGCSVIVRKDAIRCLGEQKTGPSLEEPQVVDWRWDLCGK
jgi:hypothetical protein